MSETLQRSREATYADRLPVLGVPTTFESNERDVVDLVVREYGAWRALGASPRLLSSSEAVVHVVVRSGSRRARLGGDPTFRYEVPEPHRMEVSCELGRGAADTRRRESIAVVDPELLSRPDALVHGLIEPLTLFLLGALDRVPLHAAAVLRDEVGILLAGPSGAGKSTLVYAASRAGFSVLADDAVYIQAHPGLRVWGRHGRVHLRPDATTLFPELRDLKPTALPGGKTKLVVDTGGDRRYADRVALCLLRRDGAGPSLTQIPPALAVEELTARLDPGFDLFRADIGDRVARAAERGAWILDAGALPADGVSLLKDVVSVIAGEP